MNIDIEPPVVGIGDHPEKSRSVALAALSALYQLQEMGVVSMRLRLSLLDR